MAERVDDVLERTLGGHLRHAVPLGPLTTYRVGGPARWFVEVVDEVVLGALGAAVAATGVPTLVVGLGSNLLVADSGFDGIAVRLGGAFEDVEVHETTVVAGAAAKLPVVARRTVAEGLTGFEWAVGVPGSIGGAVRMNAGGHGADLADALVSIRVLDLTSGEDDRVAAAALDLGYRRSAIGPADLVVDAELRLEPGDPDAGREAISEIVNWRRAHQPGGANAGSVFTNPTGDSAGRLIESAGLKGHRIGSAEVSTKHANFIQADDGGDAADVLALMDHIRTVVATVHGVELEPETRVVGFGAGVDRR